MAKLTGAAIESAIQDGSIVIQGFDRANLNPNSYNLALGPKLLVYKPRHWWTPWRRPLEWGQTNPPDFEMEIPEEGVVIRPGWLYLGSTREYTETHANVPILDGRSSGGRMSLHVHATAGYGDIGFCSVWTMEIHSIVPVRIFAGSRICQISYHTVEGEIRDTYDGRYNHAGGPLPSIEKPLSGRKLPTFSFDKDSRDDPGAQCDGNRGFSPPPR